MVGSREHLQIIFSAYVIDNSVNFEIVGETSYLPSTERWTSLLESLVYPAAFLERVHCGLLGVKAWGEVVVRN